MSKEKILTVSSRKYAYLSTNRYFTFKGHKKYEKSIIITFENKGGEIEFNLTNLSSGKSHKLTSSDAGTHEFPLPKLEKVQLYIKSSKAIGSYKIQVKTVENDGICSPNKRKCQ